MNKNISFSLKDEGGKEDEGGGKEIISIKLTPKWRGVAK